LPLAHIEAVRAIDDLTLATITIELNPRRVPLASAVTVCE